MIDIHAPWCKHCAALEPIWTALAERLDGRVLVGKVDGTREKGLMKRFSVEAFPSIFLVEGAETRVYTGVRTLQELESFASGKYKDVKPLPFYKSPTSSFGRAFAILIRLPAKFKTFVKYLHEEKKYSALVIVAGILGMPLALGPAGRSGRGGQEGLSGDQLGVTARCCGPDFGRLKEIQGMEKL
ncbi:hypothetical protein WJX75_005071 [Coccomyxa subellipsoidea]|uniref:Thioredoxin domain-containing protein n=1 Tax=Coccomyxa subellipsoidea TaxID=248742 RepID=A0ABR2Z438_9CHLO